MSRLSSLLLATCAVLAVPTAMAAEPAMLVGLTDGRTLSLIDAQRRMATRSMPVTGIEAPLLGIDVRPADGMLYGLAADGWIVTIDSTGQATPKSRIMKLPAAGSTVTVDFNPVADRLRVMGSDGTNLRINVDDGKLIEDGALRFAATDMHAGERPNVVAGAYTNSMKGAKETALYDIDATIGGLLKQAPPNDGVLNAVGKLGTIVGRSVAFDIGANGTVANYAWLASGGTLYMVDLNTGGAYEAGRISGLKGELDDLAALPNGGFAPSM